MMASASGNPDKKICERCRARPATGHSYLCEQCNKELYDRNSSGIG